MIVNYNATIGQISFFEMLGQDIINNILLQPEYKIILDYLNSMESNIKLINNNNLLFTIHNNGNIINAEKQFCNIYITIDQNYTKEKAREITKILKNMNILLDKENHKLTSGAIRHIYLLRVIDLFQYINILTIFESYFK